MKNKLEIKGICRMTFTDIKTGKKEKYTIKNLVVDSGLETMLASLTDFTHIAIGSDDTPVNGSQTGLINEYARRPIQSLNPVGNKLYLSTFFAHTEGNGTIKEVGTITGGTDTANSGSLFSRISTENGDLPKTKTDQQSLTIDWEFTLLNS